MFLEHVRFSFDVELLTDAHIGNGGSLPLKAMRPGHIVDGEQADVEVATIARDDAGDPAIPATSLKGSLRKALISQMHRNELDHLFGSIKSDAEGAMGQFSFYAGVWDSKSVGDHLALPYWEAVAGSWIATRVAISRQHGAAEHMKLFSSEMLPACSVFRIDGIWFDTLERAQTHLPRILSPLGAREGLPIGAGSRLGQGGLRMRKADKQVALSVTRFVAETGNVETRSVKENLTVRAPSTTQPSATLKLTCEGPFLSVDQSRKKGTNEANRILALKRDQDTPALYLSSISGALRSRAAWLSACEGLGGDERFRKSSSWSDACELTPVERLFGVGGWRGLLRLSQPKLISAKGHRDLTSVAIDKFSGAVLDSALFSYEVFTGVELELSLMLEQRIDKHGTSVPFEVDKRLFEILLNDLAGDVLLLGHATNRGFGWFAVDAIQRQEAT
ncbi:RAMP superfamily CRISPR-associated protein [Rhizobium sp. CECT 9324]|uniref:RAMP superfamily CRISPR-associated protein n=1 Tax=Rhizobium sp. CECT 9324 TaxID=2845820 RepID=UPI001E4820F0|nr:RAMP superfamily CRISPR-associated protein [Rhizobium sp. CECT 9324]CAH0343036.1 hypothetical protein RHI9324_04769 [Rhizobium sp. CECT 9324]